MGDDFESPMELSQGTEDRLLGKDTDGIVDPETNASSTANNTGNEDNVEQDTSETLKKNEALPTADIASSSSSSIAGNSTPNDGGERAIATSSKKDSQATAHTFKSFLTYRHTHPGPRSQAAYRKWKSLGGRDHPQFRWKKNPKKFKKNHDATTAVSVEQKNDHVVPESRHTIYNNFAPSVFNVFK